MTDSTPSLSQIRRQDLSAVARAARKAAMAAGVPDDPESPSGSGSNVSWRGVELWARVVCQRLREARLLNGLTLEGASELIGYGGNKTQLSLFESAGRFPPLWVIVHAAIHYGVPLDYLFGLIEEDDVHRFGLERSALTAQLEAMLTRNAKAVASAAAHALEAGLPAVQMTRELVEKTGAWIHAYDRFKARNPEQFADMPAGALALPAALSKSGFIDTLGDTSDPIRALFPSRVPSILGFEYAGSTILPVVIESISQPITAPRNRSGARISVAVPIHFTTLTAVDRNEYRAYSVR